MKVLQKNYNEEIDKEYFHQVGVQYREKLYDYKNYPHNDLLLLPEKWKLKKFEDLIANLNHKTGNVIHIRNLK